MSRLAALRELERRIEDVTSRPASVVEAVSTGIDSLDALLPGGGLPRGRATEWLGPRSCGKMALLHRALRGLHALGEPVAVVDAARTLYAPDWMELLEPGPAFWMVRPPPGEAVWCADHLLRSGAFGTVVLDTAGAVSAPRGVRRSVGVRLQCLAEEAGAVLVMAAELPVAGLRLRFRPGRIRPDLDAPFGPFIPPTRPVWVRVGKGGWVEIPVACPLPLARDPGIRELGRDRKGRR